VKTPKQIISTNITEWVERAEKNGHPVANQVKLCHAVGNGESQQRFKVQSWVIAWPGTNLNDLVTQILDTATEHANSGKIVGTGAEEYHLIPYFGTDLEEGGFRRFTIYAVRASTSEGGGPSEGPNDVGQRAQGMRHLEKRFEQVEQKDMFLTGALQEELKRAYARIGVLEKELSLANQGLEEAKDKSLERKLSIYKANSEEQRKDRALDAIIPVAGMLANAAMGAPVFNVNTEDQSQKMIISFLSSLNSKQLEHMHQAMDPQQKIFFDHVIEQITKMKIEEMRKKQRESEATINGVENDPRTVENLAKRAPQAPDGGPS
jgi:hypothetical protein